MSELEKAIQFCSLNRVELEFEGEDQPPGFRVYAAYRRKPYLLGEFGHDVVQAVANLKENMESMGAPINEGGDL